LDPLPELRAADLRGRGVLHQTEYRNRSPATEPRLQVPQRDGDVHPQPRLGNVARRGCDVEQVSGAHRDVLAGALDLVRARAERLVEDLAYDADQSGMGHPRTVEAVRGLPLLVRSDLGERGLVG